MTSAGAGMNCFKLCVSILRFTWYSPTINFWKCENCFLHFFQKKSFRLFGLEKFPLNINHVPVTNCRKLQTFFSMLSIIMQYFVVCLSSKMSYDSRPHVLCCIKVSLVFQFSANNTGESVRNWIVFKSFVCFSKFFFISVIRAYRSLKGFLPPLFV